LETLCEIGEARKVTILHDSARYDGKVAPASSRGMAQANRVAIQGNHPNLGPEARIADDLPKAPVEDLAPDPS
jgi:hypothetical protein